MYCRNCGKEVMENQAICMNCGVEVGNGKGYCYNCGSEVAHEAVICVKCGVSLKKTEPTPAATPAPVVNNAEPEKETKTTKGISKRSIVGAILLSLVTCGIYPIFWFISLTNDMNKLSGRTSDASGGMALLLTIVTCGIYGIIWSYKMGEKRDIIANVEKGSSHILYLILSLFGLSIIVWALAQDAINHAIDGEQA